MNLYLAGPMRGRPLFNFPAFHEAAKRLRSLGHRIFSPAERDIKEDGFDPASSTPKTMAEYMMHDLPAVCEADAIALLPGWEESEGCQIETTVARMLRKPLLDANTLEPVRKPGETILDEALRLCHGARQIDYGHPLDDFARTAGMISALFANKLKPGSVFAAEDVPLLMQCVKLSREVNHPKRDNRIDGCGYWHTLQMLIDERERRASRSST